jgi:hypothetical protein
LTDLNSALLRLERVVERAETLAASRMDERRRLLADIDAAGAEQVRLKAAQDKASAGLDRAIGQLKLLADE